MQRTCTAPTQDPFSLLPLYKYLRVVVEVNTRVGCGGAQVRPGDIVGCDDDGVLVVPLEIAEEVAVHARAILLADMHGRRALYQRLGMPFDETVDYEAVEAYYRELG